jgi:hypothetical protein
MPTAVLSPNEARDYELHDGCAAGCMGGDMQGAWRQGKRGRMTYRVWIAYKGEAFSGWQWVDGARTVQG